MDVQKTGALIAAARKSKGWTQKQLADRLQLSDRTVSKWERGAGFPDISLLEPLADALELEVLDLLRGERSAASDVDSAVKETLRTVRQVQRHGRLQTMGQWAKTALLFLLFLLLLAQMGCVRRPVDHTALAGVYQGGILTAVTEVRVKGSVCYSLPEVRTFQGTFQTALVQVSMDPERQLRFRIPFSPGKKAHPASRSWYGNVSSELRPFIGGDFCLTPSMKDFAFSLTDGRVVATSYGIYNTFAQLYDAPPLNTLP